MKMGKWSIAFAVVLTLLTAYMLLDTFVIPEAYVKDVSISEQQAVQVVVSDGRTQESEGLSLYELAEFWLWRGLLFSLYEYAMILMTPMLFVIN